MKIKQSIHNKTWVAKNNLVQFKALVTKELRDNCKISGFKYSKIIEEGFMSLTREQWYMRVIKAIYKLKSHEDDDYRYYINAIKSFTKAKGG